MSITDFPERRILIVEPDAAARVALGRMIEAHPVFGRFCVVADNAGDREFAGVIGPEDFGRPFRLGALLDKALALQTRPARPSALPIGPYMLDPSGSSLARPDGTDIRLTEKEKEILLILYAAHPAAIGREELLGRVWGYAEGVQTHTLETHIYRLRQKIERDPAVPEVLRTVEDGYVLGKA